MTFPETVFPDGWQSGFGQRGILMVSSNLTTELIAKIEAQTIACQGLIVGSLTGSTFFMELSARRVQIGGVANKATDCGWHKLHENLTDEVDGFFRGKRYLIHDRDPLYTQEFLKMLADLESVKLPPRSPNLNAYAERL
jgi:hypothetical protein